MSNFTLLEIKSENLRLAAQIIEELLAKHQLRCEECRTGLELTSGQLRISPKYHFQRRPQLLCIRCVSRNSQGCELISFGFVYEVVKCFNAFDMKQLTKAIADKIKYEVNLKNSLKPHEKEQILKTLSLYFGDYSQKQQSTSDMSFEVKINIVLQCLNEVVKKIIEKEVFANCCENKQVYKLSEEKAAHLIRLLRNEIGIKLEALKTLRHIISNHSQQSTIEQFSEDVLELLHQPLRSFYTNKSNRVCYSLARRQIMLKPRQEYSMIQEGNEGSEGDDEVEQLVRLNEPLQSKPAVFKLKCPYGNEQVRLGFFFMNQQDYKEEAQYERPFQPLQIVFNLYPNLNNRMQQVPVTQRGENEISRPNLSLSPETKRQKKMSFSTFESMGQKKKFAMSFKKDVENLETKEFDVEDGTLIELKYQKSSKTVTVTNLSQDVQIYQKKFYTKTYIDLNKIVVFPCVVLTGPNCKVEYILPE